MCICIILCVRLAGILEVRIMSVVVKIMSVVVGLRRDLRCWQEARSM
jgi:hypothetical protein